MRFFRALITVVGLCFALLITNGATAAADSESLAAPAKTIVNESAAVAVASGGYCSVPAQLGGWYGPDSDTWRVSSATGTSYLYVGDICRQHDRCYSGAWGQFRSQCDNYFHYMLRNRCTSYFEVSGPFTRQSHCLGIANEWYWGVRLGGAGNWGGPPSYND